MLQLHLPLRLNQILRLRHISFLLRLIQKPEHPLCGRHGRLQITDDICRFVDRPRKFPGIQHERRNISHAHTPEQIQDRSEHTDQGKGKIIDKIHHRPHNASIILRPVICLHGFLILFLKTPDGIFLLTICLQRPLPRNHLRRKTVQLSQRSRPCPEKRPGLPREITGDTHGKRHGKSKDQHQSGRDHQHHEKGSAHRDHGRQKLHHILRQRHVHRIDIIGDPADDIPSLMHVKITYRK